MRFFVTGGTGFLGRRVVHGLLERGYDVICLVRRPETATELHEKGVAVIEGDSTDQESLRKGMTGADVVFHIPGWLENGGATSARGCLEQLASDGTRNVLALAVELGVPKILYSSTVGVLGDTHGLVVNESHQCNSRFDSVHDRIRRQAHQIAEQYAAQGAPIVIVMPAEVYGPGAQGFISTYLCLQLRRSLPVMPGADTGFTLVHVDDVAEGHILAAEKGQVGHSYILGGDVVTVGDVLTVTARLAGVPAPLLLLDAKWITLLRPLMNGLGRFRPMPAPFSSEMMCSIGQTWWVTSAKAERELGYTHRAIEEGMAETVLWEAAQLGDQRSIVRVKPLLTAVASALLLGLILSRRRCKHV